ncbi:MAG: hypothetical protein KC621_02760 [Myxococcales bacterium]|nr:hypothetical protein [Myxococcales bacterium]
MQTFDGFEGVRDEVEAPPCSSCGAVRTLELWDFAARARPASSLSDERVAALGLHRSAERGWVSTRVGPGLPTAYVGDLPCPACGATTEVVIGLQEVQPARWIGGLVR